MRELARALPVEDAQDVASTAWMIAVRRRIEGNVWAYVSLVAHRLAHRVARRTLAPIDLAADLMSADHLEDRAAWLDLLHAAESLTSRQRALLGLSASGLGRDEIGAMTGDTLKTIDRQLGRARRQLRGATSAPYAR